MKETITAPALLILRKDKGYSWAAHCPLCGGLHFHGGGSAGEDPRQYLGGRAPHCLDSGLSGGRDYLLVDYDPSRTAAILSGASFEESPPILAEWEREDKAVRRAWLRTAARK